MGVEYIAYYRVSTDKQGKSGLGLEAQQAAVGQSLKEGDRIVGEYVEVETGKGADGFKRRPQLKAAVDQCRKRKATLLVAKLDRVARNVKFFLELLDSGLLISFCNLPQSEGPMGRYILTQMAAVAELEAGLISERTKAALAAAKARGTKLGNPILLADPAGFAASREAVFRGRYLEGVDLMAEIMSARDAGAADLRSLADALNAKGVPTPRGGRWHLSSVHRQIRRLGL